MTRIKVRSRVGADGRLNAIGPIGAAGLNREVIGTVESAHPLSPPARRAASMRGRLHFLVELRQPHGAGWQVGN